MNRRPRPAPPATVEPVVLRLFGPGDAVTETGLRMQLRRAAATAAAQGRQLVVDLSDVPFMDAAGLASLIEVKTVTGNRLTIENPPRSLVRILQALNLEGQFRIVTTRLTDPRAGGDQIA